MSNPTTNYTVGGIDLSNIFQPLSLGTQINFNTGYILSDGRDLRSIFAAYISGDQASITNYTVTNRGDLNTIFAKYNPIPYTITGTYNTPTTATINSVFYNTYIVFTSGIGSITINRSNVTLNYFIVGGGGNGGVKHGLISISTIIITSLGGGGGGGQVKIGNLVITSGQEYNLSVGNNTEASNFDTITSNSGRNAYSGTNPVDLNDNSSPGAASGNGNSGGTFGVYSYQDGINTIETYIGGGGGGNSGVGLPGGNNSMEIGGAGGVGTLFNGIVYGAGGGGANGGIRGGGQNTGGGGAGADTTSGNSGSSGVVILYFNI